MNEDIEMNESYQAQSEYDSNSNSDSSYNDQYDQSETFLRKRKKKYNSKKQKQLIEDLKSSKQAQNKKETSTNISEDASILLKKLTKNFSLTYKDIQKDQEFQKPPLLNISKEDIQNHIRVMRQKINRKNLQIQTNNDQTNSMIDFLTNLYETEDISKSLNKNLVSHQKINNQDQMTENEKLQIAKISSFILENYKDIDRQLQIQINSTLCEKLIKDKKLLNICKNEQVKQQESYIIDLFKKRDLEKIIDQIKQLSFDQILDIHLKACVQIKDLSLEGQTLFITFYPFLDSLNLLEKINQDNKETFNDIIFSINRHLVDNSISYSSNFLQILIEIYPQIAQKNILKESNLIALKTLLKDKGFLQSEINSICTKPQNFLWSQFLDKILITNILFRNDIVHLLSKTQVLQDPSNIYDDYLKLFSQRRILLTLICENQEIQLPLQRLLIILQQMRDFDITEIKSILQLDESQWLREINKRDSLNNPCNLNDNKKQEKFLAIYDQVTSNVPSKQKVSIEVLENVSKIVEEICDEYKHSQYQVVMSAAILSHYQSVIQIHIPTSSGKTWIQCLIAQYWIQKNFQVLLIVPNEVLKSQQERLLLALGPKFSIQTIEEFYKTKNNHEILIVDEYDFIIKNYPFSVYNGKLTGFWDFTVTNCYLFSATCDQGILRILKKIFGQPAQIEFKSEFEIFSGVQQEFGGDVKIFQSKDEKIQYLYDQIKELGNRIPLILFADIVDHKIIEQEIKNFRIQNYLKGISLENLDQISCWSSGILLLSPDECIGYNTRFRQDSKVIILCKLESEAQYHQMRGRSSRTRGLLQSEYLVVSQLLKSQIITGMKKLSIIEINQKEKLLDIVFKKRNSKTLASVIQEAQQNNEKIISVQDLRQIMGDVEFKKLTINMK